MDTNATNAQPFFQMLTPEQWDFLSEEPYATIFNLIHPGKEHATPAFDIWIYVNLPNERKIRKHIETMRREGIIIASNSNGYWLPATEKELEEYVRRTEKTAKSVLYTLKHARMALKKIQTNAT